MSNPPLRFPEEWTGTTSDPNDEQFGHLVEPTAIEGASDYRAVLVGEPYDGAVIGTPGAREAPAAICDSLAGVKTHHFDAGPVDSVGDLGTIDFPVGASVTETQDTVRNAAGRVHDQETTPIFLGGDNSLTYPNVAPLLDREGTVGVVSLDAHLDCRTVQGEPSSGSPYRQLWEAGLDEMAVLGARHFETSTAYAEYLQDQGGEVVTAEEVGDDPVEAADRALAAVEADHLYLSVDMDVLDATAAPGVSAPTPGGITTRELFRLVRLLASDDRLAGFEVVETAPPLCPDGRTADAAARTVAHALSVLGGESA
ncbi:formimidoylglutamase [Halovenus salina]|uniref:Formimidoylglutamase n=1 Tax=Halovenus salina TaxID=1510225 RepID=A0ABD5W4Z1_9EURY|nr:formimidoylglutamase [Halovenus salina]